MADKPLYEFVSHIDGKNAKVQIWPDRIEWERNKVSAFKVMTGVGFVTGFKNKNTDMVPMKMITSVTSKKGAGFNTIVSVNTAGGAVEFRVGHKEAEKARNTLNQLILGVGQPAAATAVPVAAPAAPDVTAQLTQLKGLLDAGVLSQAEYDAKKTELLARM
jgi:hypothetical protein